MKLKQLGFSTKKLQLDKTNTTIVAVITVAMFLTIFSLVASKSLMARRNYQEKAIAKQETALKQLTANQQAITALAASYQAFAGQKTNVIGGNLAGTGPNDGDNAKIVLDALPSKYDFPALATSISKIFTSYNLTTPTVSGTDDEAQQNNKTVTDNPTPVEIPFQVSANGGYTNIQGLIAVFERSIRPFTFTQLTITSAGEGKVALTGSLKTYYLPAKTFAIAQEEQ